jgi:hypothetical protein
MDFRELGRKLLASNEANPEKANFSLREVVSEVRIPEDTQTKVDVVAARLRLVANN